MRVAGWIKEGKMGDYGDTDSVRFRRESGILVITFVPEKAGRKELRLEDVEALQLAAALASVRQNVSEVGNKTNIRGIGGCSPWQLSIVL